MLNNSDTLDDSRSISENSSIHSQSDPLINSVLVFFKQLNKKNLTPKLFSSLFFSSPLHLFSEMKQISIEDLRKKIASNLHYLIKEKKELNFLEKFYDLKEAFLQNMEKTLFSGLLIYVLCFLFNLNCKIFQYHDRKSLVSCSIDLEGEDIIRIAIIISNQGFQFCSLTKTKR